MWCRSKLKLCYLCILICFLLQLWSVLCARSGPFKSSFTKVGPCQTPTPPLDPDPPCLYRAELYNTSTEINLMRGNITVVKDCRMKKVKAKNYIWDSNKWKVHYQINNMGCNSVYFPALIKTTGLRYNAKTCTFYKGEFLFSNFNINKLQHSWMSKQEYGRMLWRFEVYSNAGTVFCYEYETLIEQNK